MFRMDLLTFSSMFESIDLQCVLLFGLLSSIWAILGIVLVFDVMQDAWYDPDVAFPAFLDVLELVSGIFVSMGVLWMNFFEIFGVLSFAEDHFCVW